MIQYYNAEDVNKAVNELGCKSVARKFKLLRKYSIGELANAVTRIKKTVLAATWTVNADDPNSECICSNCGFNGKPEWDYCPRCGEYVKEVDAVNSEDWLDLVENFFPTLPNYKGV